MNSYKVMKAMSDHLFSDPAKLATALRKSVRKEKRFQRIFKELNQKAS